MKRGETKKEILLVENKKDSARLVSSSLKKRFPYVRTDLVATWEGALSRLKEREYKLIISKFPLKGVDGETMIHEFGRLAPKAPLIAILDRKAGEEVAEAAIELGIGDYVYETRELLKGISSLVEKAFLRQKISMARSSATVPITLIQKIGLELDLLRSRSNLIAKNAANSEIIDSIQEQIGKVKRIAQKFLPG